jgi:hypothetical protein
MSGEANPVEYRHRPAPADLRCGSRLLRREPPVSRTSVGSAPDRQESPEGLALSPGCGRPRVPAASGGRPEAILALQRAAGNRAVNAVMSRQVGHTLARCSGRCTCGGQCTHNSANDDDGAGETRRVERAIAAAVKARSRTSPRNEDGATGLGGPVSPVLSMQRSPTQLMASSRMIQRQDDDEPLVNEQDIVSSDFQDLFPRAFNVWSWITDRSWTCDAKCNVYPVEDGAKCPDRVLGTGSGASVDTACDAAKEDANSKVPAGCNKRHCHGPCKGSQGSKGQCR